MEREQALYNEFAKYYDRLYSKKSYLKQTNFIFDVLNKHNVEAQKIIDFGCGTGNHDKLLVKGGYSVTGIDLNKEMLKIAKKKVPRARYFAGDMRTFRSKEKFDLVICMFNVISYNLTTVDLVKTLKNFKRHLRKGGLIIFDFPVETPEFKNKDHTYAEFLSNNLAMLFVDYPVENERKRNIDIYWMSKKRNKVEVKKDIHRIRVYSPREISSAIKKAGLAHKLYRGFSLTERKGKHCAVCWQI